MIKFYDELEQAIQQTKKVEIRFKEKETWILKDRVCIPYDFGKTKKIKKDMFHFYDLNPDDWKTHNLSLNPEQIIDLIILEDKFNPCDYVKWDWPYNWNIQRNWWIYS